MASSISFHSVPLPVVSLAVGAARVTNTQQQTFSDTFCPSEPDAPKRRGDFWKACQAGPTETNGPLVGFDRLVSAVSEAGQRFPSGLHKAHDFLGPLATVTQLNSDNPGDVAGSLVELSADAGNWMAKNGPQVLRKGAGEFAEHLTPWGHVASIAGLALDVQGSGRVSAELEHAHSWQDPSFNARIEQQKAMQQIRQGGLKVAAGFEAGAMLPGIGAFSACLGALTEVGVKALTDDRDELVAKGLIPEHGFYG